MFWMSFQPAGEPAPRKQRVITLYDTPGLPRQVWEDFRARTAAGGEAWIDVLRRFMENHGKEAPDTTTRE
jgi:hypothetical protein